LTSERILGDSVNRVFVTGGAGFIGSHVCEQLLDQGYSVTCYDNFSNGRKQFIERILDSSEFRLVSADCRDLSRLKREMKDHDLVWHLAANTDIIGSCERPDRDLNDCIIATFNVLEAMRQNEVSQILFSSSGATYGRLALDHSVREIDGPLIPLSTYAAGKIASEALINSYCHLFGIRGWIYRFGNVIGSRMTHGVIFDFVSRLKSNPSELLILGDGSQEKNYFLTDDCINGMGWLFRNCKPSNENPCNVYNLGSRDTTKVTEIARIVIDAMKLTSVTAIRIEGKKVAWPGDQPRVFLNVEYVSSLGWKCSRSSTEAVVEAVRRTLSSSL